MTSTIFSVASFTLMAWLSVSVVFNSQQLVDTKHLLSAKLDASNESLKNRIDAIQIELQAELQAQKELQLTQNQKEEPEDNEIAQLESKLEQLNLRLNLQNEYWELQAAYQQVMETEIEKHQDSSDAAEKLLNTKSAIWKASTQHENVKDDLRGLMASIDILAASWRRGDTSGTVEPVFSVLQSTLATLNTL